MHEKRKWVRLARAGMGRNQEAVESRRHFYNYGQRAIKSKKRKKGAGLGVTGPGFVSLERSKMALGRSLLVSSSQGTKEE